MLFPTGYSGSYRIQVGQWRQDESGLMQVVSGAMGKEKIHFQAPGAVRLPAEMDLFIRWFNQPSDALRLDPVLKAALAHLYFVTIHPMEDGNGPMARAITDLQLARVDQMAKRFYSMSFQIERHRRKYYAILEQTQKADVDVTDWLTWFLTCLSNAIAASNQLLSSAPSRNYFSPHQRPLLLEMQSAKGVVGGRHGTRERILSALRWPAGRLVFLAGEVDEQAC